MNVSTYREDAKSSLNGEATSLLFRLKVDFFSAEVRLLQMQSNGFTAVFNKVGVDPIAKAAAFSFVLAACKWCNRNSEIFLN